MTPKWPPYFNRMDVDNEKLVLISDATKRTVLETDTSHIAEICKLCGLCPTIAIVATFVGANDALSVVGENAGKTGCQLPDTLIPQIKC